MACVHRKGWGERNCTNTHTQEKMRKYTGTDLIAELQTQFPVAFYSMVYYLNGFVILVNFSLGKL